MPESLRPIGLLGGTFDPIHVGHLRLALEVRQRTHLGEVRLLPAPRPRLRDAPWVNPDTRLRLVCAAVQGVDGLSVDGRELERDGPTRTVETLATLREQLGPRPLCWIMGADAARRLDQWHDWRQLPELAHIIIARRPGAVVPSDGTVGHFIAERLCHDANLLAQQANGWIHICDIPGLDISSSGIRAMLVNGEPIDFLVPETVQHILQKEGLYIHG